MPPLVSVVTPTFNRRASVDRYLLALAGQTCSSDRFEVLVVDDGSSDGTADHLRQLRLPYDLRVLEQAHGGPARARNLGVANARGAIVLFLDDDVVPEPDLIAEHLRSHEAGTDRVVVGPMLPPPDSFPRSAWVRWEETMLLKQYRDMLAGKYSCTPRQFYTANASVPRELFLRVGGFDTSYQRAEDVELGYRLRDHGAAFVFNNHAAILHYATRSFESWCRTPYQYGRYDVAMQRDKGAETLLQATCEFRQRHPLTRLMVLLCVSHARWGRMALLAMRGAAAAAERLRMRRAGKAALSGIHNVLYWQGVDHELGGRGQARHLLKTVCA